MLYKYKNNYINYRKNINHRFHFQLELNKEMLKLQLRNSMFCQFNIDLKLIHGPICHFLISKIDK